MDTFLLQLLFLLGWPLLLALGVTWATWGALRRPLLFLVVSCVALYLLYALAQFVFGPASVGFVLSVRQPGDLPVESESFVLLRPYAASLAAFTVAAFPVTAVLLKLFRRRGESK